MTEGYGGEYGSEESAQDRARRRLQELEEQRLSQSPEETEDFPHRETFERREASEYSEASDERSETSEKTSGYARQGQEKAGEVAEQGREKAKGQISTQKERASGELQGVARALRSTGEQLREQDQDSIGQYADQAADQVERLSNYLGEKDSEELISEVEDLARNRPAVFLGGAFLVGVAAARFLKSSAGQTGDLKEELKQEAQELQKSATASGAGETGGSGERESYYRVRGGEPR